MIPPWIAVSPRFLIKSSKIRVRFYRTADAPSSLEEDATNQQFNRRSNRYSDEYADVDWSRLRFSLTPTDYMYVTKTADDEEFKEGRISSFGNIELNPAAGVLNYGQGVFEGVKAYRREDGGICLFRPKENAIRLQIGARRLCMPFPSADQFVDAIKQTTLANKRWIPPPGKGALYLRPLLFGSGATLGVAPAPEYTFLVYATPVGNYFKEGMAALNLYVEEEYHRTTRGGVGGVKSITNYAPVMKAMIEAKAKGFSDVLYLDSVNKRNVEELSASNVFTLKGNVVSTPEANGTILEGITRKSIMEIVHDLGYEVVERSIPIEELLEADEVFCTGTAVVVMPIGSVTYKGKRNVYKKRSPALWEKLHSTITGIQCGTVQDNRRWILQIAK